MKHIIYKGDSLERIKEFGDNSIHLTISSPPYFNAKDYHKEDKNVGNNLNYMTYLAKIDNLIRDLYRVTVNGGIVVWNTSPVLDDGKRYGIPFDTHKIFIDAGFEFLEDIVWCKPMGAAKLRSGGWYQNNGAPLTWHANIATEYIMIYKKPGVRERGNFNPIKHYYPEIPKDLSSNTWFMNPETQTTWHDAPFCRELVKRCILLYSFIGDTILDPFAGSFTTTCVARDLERNSIGMEISEEYVKKAKEKMGFYQKNLFQNIEYIEK